MSNYVFDQATFPALANVRDRTPDKPGVERVFFGEGDVAQAADVNEGFSREAEARKAIGDLVAGDGDRLDGCTLIVDTGAASVTLAAGVIYLLGKPRTIDAAVLNAVPMTGTVLIGVYVSEDVITAADDGDYYGLVEGTDSYGEAGGVRTKKNLAWGFSGDGQSGDFYRFSTLIDGVEVSSQAPTTLSGVQRQISLFDYDRNGHYVVRGNEVIALSLVADTLELTVKSGTSNVLGTKVIKSTDTPLSFATDPDVSTVDAEPHTYVDNGGSATIRVNHGPIAAVNTVIVTKEKTVTLTKGATNGQDALPDTSVTSIELVVQGATTYVATTDYLLTSDSVDWSPGGSEPGNGSSYDVTYRYLDAVSVDSFTEDEITVSGGVDGELALLGYSFKQPRWDALLLNQDGTFTYLRGKPSPTNPRPPVEPDATLGLAVIKHDWYGLPTIVNRSKRPTVDEVIEMRERLNDALLLIGHNRLETRVSGRNAGKTLGIFVDPFNDESYRDAGETQDAAVVNGSLQLAIDTSVIDIALNDDLMLSYTHEVAIEQGQATSGVKINPYQNFNPLPYEITVSPASDTWTEYTTEQLAAVTRVFGAGNRSRITSQSTLTNVSTLPLSYLRQIDIGFTIKGMGVGETLNELLFDGVDVNPGGLVADGSGVITGTFTIPAGRSAGTKAIEATGGSGNIARTIFEGQGYVQKTTSQEVSTIERFFSDWWMTDGSVGYDPQAQTFVQAAGRHISGVGLKFSAIGDRSKPVEIDVVLVTDDFYPSVTVVARKRLDMNPVQVGVWTPVYFDLPPYVPAGTYRAFVVKTDDGDHAIYQAELGQFDPFLQQWVTGQPYTAGDRYDGSNGRAWLLHPKSDLTFRVYAPRFTANQRTVNLGTFAVADCSDIQILANEFIPDADCSVVYKVTVGSTIYTVVAGQTIELDAFYTGNISVSAVLTGTEFSSPIVRKEMQILIGTIRETGSYVGLVWTMGDTVDLQGSVATKIPSGATLTVSVDANDDTWTVLSQTDAAALDDGFIERFYELADHMAPNGGRIKIDLTGGPAARPSVCDLNFSVGV